MTDDGPDCIVDVIAAARRLPSPEETLVRRICEFIAGDLECKYVAALVRAKFMPQE